MTIIIYVFVYAILAETWDLLAGYTGLISFGHAAFFGVGAYTSALLSIDFGISPWLGLVLGGGTAALFGLVVGYPTLRLRGPYFAIATLAFAEAARISISSMSDVTGGPQGLFGYKTFEFVPYTLENYYYMGMALSVVATVILYKVVNSKFGLTLQSIRDDLPLAEMQGINTTRYRLAAFMISGFFAGMAGVFFAVFSLSITPDLLGLSVTAAVISMAMIGGRRTIWGSLFGAFLVEIVTEGLRRTGADVSLMLQGAIIALVILVLPRGISTLGRYISQPG